MRRTCVMNDTELASRAASSFRIFHHAQGVRASACGARRPGAGGWRCPAAAAANNNNNNNNNNNVLTTTTTTTIKNDNDDTKTIMQERMRARTDIDAQTRHPRARIRGDSLVLSMWKGHEICRHARPVPARGPRPRAPCALCTRGLARACSRSRPCKRAITSPNIPTPPVPVGLCVCVCVCVCVLGGGGWGACSPAPRPRRPAHRASAPVARPVCVCVCVCVCARRGIPAGPRPRWVVPCEACWIAT